MKNVVIIDYGMGNLGSIQNMLKRIGAPSQISAEAKAIARAERIILPGVGAFDGGITRLRELNLVPLLNELVLGNKIPVLGVCLGMQLLTKRSEEGSLSGLGWIDGETVKFHFDQDNLNLKIPHMGWNTMDIKNCDTLFAGLSLEARFYFVHSYHVVCRNSSDILATTTYGYPFVSAVQKENIFGVQFHPEKSHRFGMAVLENFIKGT